MQVWVFGPEEEVIEMDKKIIEEQYYLFLGLFKVQDKYTLKLKHNNDWAVYLQSNCGKFDVVKKSREYLSDDSKYEEHEIFSDKFKPAEKKGKKL